MLVQCPSCKESVEVIVESGENDDTPNVIDTFSSIHCPRCGEVEFQIDVGETRVATNPGTMSQEKLAHFSLLKLVGRGGFGSVWLAEDDNLGRQVALKVPVSKDNDVGSLLHEAKTAAKLKHPNIVSIFEVGVEEGQVFIASEFIDGMTLRDLLSTGKTTTERTCEILIDIANALQHAHENGVVHRDIKPANIILNKEGQPFVTDFGLAKKISAEASISSEGQVLGTAKYMSPEQASGKTRETDHRSDIYAIGIILFEMLTLHQPFRGNVRAILHQKIYEDAPTPNSLDPSVPKDLETICLKCLERDPEKRYQSSSEVAEELTRFQKGEPIKARPVSSIEKTWRWCRRRPGVATLLASLFLSLSLGLAGVSYFWIQALRSAEIANGMFYRAQMNLATEHLRSGDIHALKQVVLPFMDGEGLESFRGFEWNYFNSKSNVFMQSVGISDPVSDVAISRQGDLFAACGTPKEFHIWSTDTGEVLRVCKIPAGKVTTLSFSPSSSLLATGSNDGWLRFWNPVEAETPTREVKHGPSVELIRFSPDGKQIATGGKTGAVRIWSIEDLEMVAQIPTGKPELVDFRFSPDGQQLAVGTNNEIITRWDIANRIKLGTLGPCPLLLHFTYSADGKQIAAGTYSGQVLWWDVETGEQVASTPIGDGAVGDLENSNDSNQLLVTKAVGDLIVLDPATQQETHRFQTHTLSFGTIDVSRNGKLIVTGSGDGSVNVIRLNRLNLPEVLWEDKHIRQLEVLPSGNEVAVIVGDERVEIRSLNRMESRKIPKFDDKRVTSVSAHPTKNLLAIATMGNEVVLWDTKKEQVESKIPSGTESSTEALFSPDGQMLAIANRTGDVQILNLSDLTTPQTQWASDYQKLSSISFHPDSSELAVTFENGQVELRNVLKGGAITQSFEVSGGPLDACYCLEGNSLAIGTNSGSVHLWNRAEPRKVSSIKAHRAKVNTVSSFPNGQRFVTGARDRQVKIWDAKTGQLITTLHGHERQVFASALSKDGKTLVSGGLSGDIRIWRSK
ncbi:serine/threonine-protein kinase [Thalassoglobus polymorphus]|uniref:non-specific serine/threonine protein kinase n=1 Tax=Thalassoglobus polymorphus TaxID=2527994 RepID=A0A517QKJ0_9PLAN|nr:serine/threonine-protein kinase [Thalassoglobus polymorphus]QDT32145.1 Serine/threonine-protein kinase PknB [Thalassoglobus polymorphus]